MRDEREKVVTAGHVGQPIARHALKLSTSPFHSLKLSTSPFHSLRVIYVPHYTDRQLDEIEAWITTADPVMLSPELAVFDFPGVTPESDLPPLVGDVFPPRPSKIYVFKQKNGWRIDDRRTVPGLRYNRKTGNISPEVERRLDQWVQTAMITVDLVKGREMSFDEVDQRLREIFAE